MDTIRNTFVVAVSQLVVLGAIVPAFAELNESEEDDHRPRGRRCSQTISRCREDYPIITNWLTTPDTDAEPTSDSILPNSPVR